MYFDALIPNLKSTKRFELKKIKQPQKTGKKSKKPQKPGFGKQYFYNNMSNPGYLYIIL